MGGILSSSLKIKTLNCILPVPYLQQKIWESLERVRTTTKLGRILSLQIYRQYYLAILLCFSSEMVLSLFKNAHFQAFSIQTFNITTFYSILILNSLTLHRKICKPSNSPFFQKPIPLPLHSSLGAFLGPWHTATKVPPPPTVPMNQNIPPTSPSLYCPNKISPQTCSRFSYLETVRNLWPSWPPPVAPSMLLHSRVFWKHCYVQWGLTTFLLNPYFFVTENRGHVKHRDWIWKNYHFYNV